MPELELQLAALVQVLEDNRLLGEVLLFPASCFHARPGNLRKMLLRRAIQSLKQVPAGAVYKQRLGGLPHVASVDVEIPPLRNSIDRAATVALKFHYATWKHGDEAVIAYVPAVQIEVLAENEHRLIELLAAEIRSALFRRKAAESLRDLVLLARVAEVRVEAIPARVKLPTARQAAQREGQRHDREKSVLRQVATNLTHESSAPIYQRAADVARLAEWLTGRTVRSVLLVGRSGVGKTALVRELARRRGEFALTHTPLWSTSGLRIIAGASGFGMWQQRCQQLVREADKSKAVVHLDNLFELLEVGKGGGNTHGIASLLQPAISQGRLLAIAECTPEQLAVIERVEPQLLEAFARLDVAEPDAEDTRTILRRVAAAEAGGNFSTAAQAGRRRKPRRRKKQLLPRSLPAVEVQISPAALDTLDRLHRRYATYSVSPGRPLRFLRNLLADRRAGPRASEPIDCGDVTAAFSRETGLPLFMLDDNVPLSLDDTRDWFSQRVIGQPDAVTSVVQLLAAVKAQLARGGKPIGSLLFIGPTGVGKTEMAKALAEFLYRDPGRMIRFDMSEYAHPHAIDRLIGGAFASRGLLTQKVRDQPFMVVLLDEFEKAHPRLFDVLLQVLGEGRLTDGAGRVADFTNSVVIMTSNLGTESYGRSMRGFAGESALPLSVRAHFEREVKSLLRPEMVNRLDQIVPFAPLDREAIARIARREIDRVAQRDGLRQRGVPLELDEAVIARLAESGFDARYGARPLKRAIERQLVAPLAERLVRYPADSAISCRVGIVAEALQIETKTNLRPPGQRRAAAPANLASAPAAEFSVLSALVALRRQLQSLDQSGVVLRLRNEVVRLQQARREEERRQQKRQRETPGVAVRRNYSSTQADLFEQERRLKRVDALMLDVGRLEDEALGDFYAGRPTDVANLKVLLAAMEQSLADLLFELNRMQGERNGELTIVILGPHHGRLLQLADAYQKICQRHAGRTTWYWLKMYRAELDVRWQGESRAGGSASRADAPVPVMRLKSRKLHDADESRKVVDVYRAPQPGGELPSDCIGVALQLTGQRTVALLEAETGRHHFITGPGEPAACFIETTPLKLLNYDPPADVGRAGAMRDLPVRRVYDYSRESCQDLLLQKQLPWAGRPLDEVVGEAVEEYLNVRLWKLLDPWN